MTKILTHTNAERSQVALKEPEGSPYYHYGDLEGVLGYEANLEFWAGSKEYQRGYLEGTARRINNRIAGVK